MSSATTTADCPSRPEAVARLQRFYRLYYNPARPARRRRYRPVRERTAVLPIPQEMPFDDSDRALVDRVKSGDVSACASLHRRYYSRIYRFAYLRTGNADDASDIASETFCRALQRIASYEFRRSDSLYPWLHQIASNLIIDQSRARPSKGILSLDAQLAEDVESFINCLVAEGPSPHELLEKKELHAAVQEAIEQLPADQGRAVVFRFVADLSIRDIAREMDRSEGAIKSLLHRALQGLRDRLVEGARNARRSGVSYYLQERSESHAREVIQVRPGDTR